MNQLTQTSGTESERGEGSAGENRDIITKMEHRGRRQNGLAVRATGCWKVHWWWTLLLCVPSWEKGLSALQSVLRQVQLSSQAMCLTALAAPSPAYLPTPPPPLVSLSLFISILSSYLSCGCFVRTEAFSSPHTNQREMSNPRH